MKFALVLALLSFVGCKPSGSSRGKASEFNDSSTRFNGLGQIEISEKVVESLRRGQATSSWLCAYGCAENLYWLNGALQLSYKGKKGGLRLETALRNLGYGRYTMRFRSRLPEGPNLSFYLMTVPEADRKPDNMAFNNIDTNLFIKTGNPSSHNIFHVNAYAQAKSIINPNPSNAFEGGQSFTMMSTEFGDGREHSVSFDFSEHAIVWFLDGRQIVGMNRSRAPQGWPAPGGYYLAISLWDGWFDEYKGGVGTVEILEVRVEPYANPEPSVWPSYASTPSPSISGPGSDAACYAKNQDGRTCEFMGIPPNGQNICLSNGQIWRCDAGCALYVGGPCS